MKIRQRCSRLKYLFSERAAQSNNSFPQKLVFEQADVLNKEFEEEQFDLIYSKDSLKHIRQNVKSELFEKFERWLKPGGRLIIAGNLNQVKSIYSFFRLYLLRRAR